MEHVLQMARWQQLVKQFLGWFNLKIEKDGQHYLNRFRLTQLTLFFVFFLTSVANYIAHLPYSFTITLSGMGYCLLLQYLYDKGYNAFSRIAFSVLLNITAFLLCYAEGLSSGAYFFYFLVVIIANFISEKEKYGQLRVIYFFTFLMLAVTFYISPQVSFLQVIQAEDRQINLYLNAVVSFIIGGTLSYHMMKDNFLKERTLTSKQRFLDSVYNTSLDAVFIVNLDNGRIIDCNDQSTQLFGWDTRQELNGTNVYQLFFAETEADESFIRKIFSDPVMSWKGERNCVTRLGKEFAGYVSVVPIMIEGELCKKINVLDITDIKQARAALELAKEKAEQAVFARTRFVSNMSHELRTPLNGIIGTANLLAQDTYLPEQKQYFDVLKYSSEHMLNLINEILDFSKIEADKMDLENTAFDLEKMVENVSTIFKGQFEEKHIDLDISFDEQLKKTTFIGDPTRLSQVLSNLLSNALKFTKEGKVAITISQVTQNSHACTIRFVVQDSGIGIPLEKQKSIFDSFTQVESATTRKFGGTGLGLTISSKIVELYGGKLQVDSIPGEGSCFYFTIQLGIDHKPASYVNEEVVRELKSLEGLRILIAEDNPINMMIAKAVLQKWEIVVTETVNGVEALHKYKTEPFDLLLVDLEMPEMDGYELLQHIRNENKTIPIIAFTAALYENMQAHLINTGFTDYVQKPFRPEDLHSKLVSYSGR